MPPYTTAQKAAISQFVSFTSAKDSVAARQLKASGWNVELAVDTFFQNPDSGRSRPATVTNLNKLFDQYRDATTDDVDSVGMDGSIKYFNDLKVKLDEVTVLAILTLLEAPTLGELTRDGFVSGWKKLNVDTIPHQQSYALLCRETLPTDKELFTRVYNHTFSLALTQGQKAVQLETATEYWRLLLTAPSLNWSTPKTPWLTWWIEYLGTQWKKSVNKDLWKQTGKFVAESLKDETMGFWSEDGAWPSVIDDFVAFVKEKRAEGGQAMDTQ